MNRAELRQKMRDENPEITDSVISDATLNGWLQQANLEISAMTYCIVTNESATFDSVVGQQFYDLDLNIPNFYAVDDMPGGGVFYNNVFLKKVTPGEMNYVRRSWKTAPPGVPRRWWRRGQYLWFEVKPSAIKEIAVDAYLMPDPFDNDAKLPFNEMTSLIPFHDSLSKYLQWRVMQKVGKDDEAKIAKADYLDYVKWMKGLVKAAHQQSVFMRPTSSNSGLARF